MDQEKMLHLLHSEIMAVLFEIGKLEYTGQSFDFTYATVVNAFDFWHFENEQNEESEWKSTIKKHMQVRLHYDPNPVEKMNDVLVYVQDCYNVMKLHAGFEPISD